MAKELTVKAIEALTAPGRYSDGDNLYLQITKTGSKSWLFMYRWQGKQKEMGLGPYGSGNGQVTLAAARAAAGKALGVLKDPNNPRDPMAVRRQQRAMPDTIPNFGDFAEQVIADLESQWRNPKHRAQWRSTLREHGKGLWSTPVNEIDTEAVLKVLKPIWKKVPETASRVRGRIEKVLDAARARKLREGENPARWRGHLDHLLPRREKLTRGHHAAMPYDQVSAFVGELRQRDSVSARALELLVLCAARSGEVLGMTWEELDLDKAVWSLPAARMKAGRSHRVPLNGRAIEILREMVALATTGKDGKPAGVVFKGAGGGGLSVMALTMQLRRMNRQDVTPHGFRSSFRDWAAEETSFAREVAEAALAHSVGDATEQAYRRGDALEKRRKLMDAWAAYIEPKAADPKVVPLRQA